MVNAFIEMLICFHDRRLGVDLIEVMLMNRFGLPQEEARKKAVEIIDNIKKDILYYYRNNDESLRF
jgi:hypothetical protein